MLLGIMQVLYVIVILVEILLLLSNRSCPLTLAEFRLRRTVDPSLELSDEYIAYYGLKFAEALGAVPSRFLRDALRAVALAFLVISLAIKIFF